MYYPEDIIEEVRAKSDIVDIVSGYVKLKRSGANYSGLCPFHNDRTPSFHVSQSKQIYKCFACGAGGNVITFIRNYENLTFQEAIQFLAEKAGVNLPEAKYDPQARSREDKRDKIREICKEAATYYYKLLRTPRGEVGMRYLQGRALSEETMKSFGLGFAGISGYEIVNYLKGKGYSEELIRESGLTSFEEKRGLHDKFWNRVMFPIMDISNKVIGFGGRVMGEGTPKYLNSPETPIFDKGRNLYALNKARQSRKGHIILCEGYMDVISMHQAGFTEAVASLGTALTSGQASLLKRYTNTVILSYDSDGPGIKAALRAIPILKEAGIATKVLHLDPFKDPDEFIKNRGPEEFENRLREAENGFLFRVRQARAEENMDDPDGRTRFQNSVALMLCEFTDELERDNYIEAVSKEFTIPLAPLRKAVLDKSAALAGKKPYEPPKESIKKDKKRAEDPALSDQRHLITWLVDEPQVYSKIKQYIRLDDFTEPVYRQTAEYVIADIENGRWNPAAIVSHFADSDDESEVSALLDSQIPELHTKEEREKALKDVLYKVREKGFEYKRKNMAGDISVMADIIQMKKELEDLKKISLHLDE